MGGEPHGSRPSSLPRSVVARGVLIEVATTFHARCDKKLQDPTLCDKKIQYPTWCEKVFFYPTCRILSPCVACRDHANHFVLHGAKRWDTVRRGRTLPPKRGYLYLFTIHQTIFQPHSTTFPPLSHPSPPLSSHFLPLSTLFYHFNSIQASYHISMRIFCKNNISYILFLLSFFSI